jgi:hypothetical protein
MGDAKQAQAKFLNGTDVGTELYHKAWNSVGWDKENSKMVRREYERWSEVLTITHKKSGVVRIRSKYGEHLFSPDTVILLREKN